MISILEASNPPSVRDSFVSVERRRFRSAVITRSQLVRRSRGRNAAPRRAAPPGFVSLDRSSRRKKCARALILIAGVLAYICRRNDGISLCFSHFRNSSCWTRARRKNRRSGISRRELRRSRETRRSPHIAIIHSFHFSPTGRLRWIA